MNATDSIPEPGNPADNKLDVQNHVEQIMAEKEVKGLVTSYVVIAEVMYPDGNWGIEIVQPPSSPWWREAALVRMVNAQFEDAALCTVSIAEDGDDDDA